MAELYTLPRTSTATSSSSSASPLIPEGYASIKVEIESDEEEQVSDARVGKLEEEVVRLRAALEEKQQDIEKLQKEPGGKEVRHPFLVSYARISSLSLSSKLLIVF